MTEFDVKTFREKLKLALDIAANEPITVRRYKQLFEVSLIKPTRGIIEPMGQGSLSSTDASGFGAKEQCSTLVHSGKMPWPCARENCRFANDGAGKWPYLNPLDLAGKQLSYFIRLKVNQL